MKALEEWTGQAVAERPSSPDELTEEQLASARDEIGRMLQSPDAEAGAIRERLARLGPLLLPEVYARLKQASTDRDRERLLALRYRLVADHALVLRWPGGITRLAAEEMAPKSAAVLHTGLAIAYLGSTYYSPSRISRPARREVVREATSQATAGTEMQRLAALALLGSVAPDEAAQVAATLADDTRLSDELRRDAFQVLLVTLPRARATEAAIAAVRGDDGSRKGLALIRLVEDREALALLRDAIQMNVDSEGASYFHGNGRAIVPEPPPGLEPQHVRPLVDDPDPKTAAYAGYLLALLGEQDGLDSLIRYWRAREEDDEKLYKLVYRAIAALNDSTRVPLLEEIYGRLDQWTISEFYWTIRIMSGPEILRLRKRIRDEVGMSSLR